MSHCKGRPQNRNLCVLQKWHLVHRRNWVAIARHLACWSTASLGAFCSADDSYRDPPNANLLLRIRTRIQNRCSTLFASLGPDSLDSCAVFWPGITIWVKVSSKTVVSTTRRPEDKCHVQVTQLRWQTGHWLKQLPTNTGGSLLDRQTGFHLVLGLGEGSSTIIVCTAYCNSQKLSGKICLQRLH